MPLCGFLLGYFTKLLMRKFLEILNIISGSNEIAITLEKSKYYMHVARIILAKNRFRGHDFKLQCCCTYCYRV